MKLASLLIPVLFLFIHTEASAQQKFGHVNSGNLLELLPDVKKADADLSAFRDKLLAEMDTKMKAFEEKYKQAVAAFNSGELSPKQQQEKEAQIRTEQENLSKFEQNIQLQIGKKREELLQPILTKVDDAIQAVAKEGGYTMIFDTATGGMLFAKDSEDITNKVKVKLGL